MLGHLRSPGFCVLLMLMMMRASPSGFFFERGPTAGPALIYGGPGNDTIKGTEDSDTIYGGDGDDLITELARSPLIFAPGTKPPVERGDLIFGENGSDTIKGAAGHDTLDGGNGSDLLIDHYGIDTFRNGPGHDTVLAAGYDDRIYVGPGEDHVVANDLP